MALNRNENFSRAKPVVIACSENVLFPNCQLMLTVYVQNNQLNFKPLSK